MERNKKPLLVGMRNCKWSKRNLIDAFFYRRARLNGLWDKILQHMVKEYLGLEIEIPQKINP